MNKFQPKSTDFNKKVRDSFARQAVMQTLGIRIDTVRPGEVILAMDYDKALTQQHGFMHAGIITTGLDSAAGYAAFSLMADDAAGRIVGHAQIDHADITADGLAEFFGREN